MDTNEYEWAWNAAGRLDKWIFELVDEWIVRVSRSRVLRSHFHSSLFRSCYSTGVKFQKGHAVTLARVGFVMTESMDEEHWTKVVPPEKLRPGMAFRKANRKS